MGARPFDRILLTAGVVGPIVFISTFTIIGAIRPGYDAMRQYVSLLALGDGGWIQVLNFLVLGALTFGAGFALARRWTSTRSGLRAGRLISLVGVALAACGVFTGDPAQGYPAGAPAGLSTAMTSHAALHYLGAIVVFAGLPLAIMLAVRGATDRRWAWYGRLSAAVMFGSWVATFLVPGTYGVADAAGLMQRVAIIGGLGWLSVASARELVRSGVHAQAASEALRA